MEPLELVGLIVSRIAHDFAGPVSALENGTALLADETDPDLRAEFTTLLGVAAGELAARLKLYRLVFGSGLFTERLPARETRAALAAILSGERRIGLDWRVEAETLSRGETKLLLSLAMIGADALTRGDTLVVADWNVEAIGARAALSADVLHVLGGEPEKAGPRAALAHFASALAARLRLKLTAVQVAGRITIDARAEQ